MFSIQCSVFSGQYAEAVGRPSVRIESYILLEASLNGRWSFQNTQAPWISTHWSGISTQWSVFSEPLEGGGCWVMGEKGYLLFGIWNLEFGVWNFPIMVFTIHILWLHHRFSLLATGTFSM